MKASNNTAQSNTELPAVELKPKDVNFTWEQMHFTENVNQVENFVFEAVTKLPEYSTEFADAFPVLEVKGSKDAKLQPNNVYALVYKRNLPIRLKEILVYSKTHKFHDAPLAFALTPISNMDDHPHFVVILPKPSGKSLKQLVEAGIRLDENFIYKKLLPPIARELEELHQHGIVHGRINLDSVFIDQEGNVRLGECVSAACGFNQVAFFEPVERAQCQAYGKGGGDAKVDCYAIGILIHALLTGHNFWEMETSEMIRKKLHRGTFDFLVNNAVVTGRIAELIKGLIVDIPEMRWGLNVVQMYISDMGYSAVAQSDLNYLNRAIVFNNRECYSKRALAHELASNWDAARAFIKSDKIKKWLEHVSSEEKFYDYLDLLASGSSTRGVLQKAFSSEEEGLIKVLMALDPLGPIRIRDLSFQKEGIGLALLQAVNDSMNDRVQLISGFLLSNVIAIYEGVKLFYPNIDISANVYNIKKCSDFMLKTSNGFGIDRCLYELNHTLPCLQPGVIDGFVLSGSDFFKYIEQSADVAQQVICNRAVGGFLASKMLLNDEVKIKELYSYEAITKTRAYQTLILFTYAQKHINLDKIPNIARALANHLQESIDVVFKSKTLKNNFIKKLHDASKSGIVGDIAKVVCNTDFYTKDADGYARALRRGAEIAYEIFSYNDRTLLFHDTKRKSLNLAIKFSYVASLFMLLSLILRGI